MHASIIAALISYLVMAAAFLQPRRRALHIPAMAAVILFDLSIPFYLYAHGHWAHRLIDQQEMFSVLIWMHFGILISMYALDVSQFLSARKIMQGDMDARAQHRAQGKALLVVRLFVILTGAMLAP